MVFRRYESCNAVVATAPLLLSSVRIEYTSRHGACTVRIQVAWFRAKKVNGQTEAVSKRIITSCTDLLKKLQT
jgi:hypothetical protein